MNFYYNNLSKKDVKELTNYCKSVSWGLKNINAEGSLDEFEKDGGILINNKFHKIDVFSLDLKKSLFFLVGSEVVKNYFYLSNSENLISEFLIDYNNLSSEETMFDLLRTFSKNHPNFRYAARTNVTI